MVKCEFRKWLNVNWVFIDSLLFVAKQFLLHSLSFLHKDKSLESESLRTYVAQI